MSVTDTLTPLVRNAFDNAAENGYGFKGWTDEQIANDMCDCDAEIGEYHPAIVLGVVRSVRHERQVSSGAA